LAKGDQLEKVGGMVMKKRLRLGNKGLTLIELIVGLALTTVVMTAIASFLITNINFSNLAQDELYVQEQVRKSMRAFTNLVMEKERIQSITTGGSGASTYTQSVTFSGDQALTITFDLVGQELKYKLGTNPEQSLAKNISKFFIEEDASNSKLIYVTIEGKKNPGDRKK